MVASKREEMDREIDHLLITQSDNLRRYWEVCPPDLSPLLFPACWSTAAPLYAKLVCLELLQALAGSVAFRLHEQHVVLLFDK